MAVVRPQPYNNQNFLVDLGSGATGPDSGFAEVIIPGISIDVVEYRTGNRKENDVQKFAGLAKVGDVTLRRGVTGSLTLYQWIDAVRNGVPNSTRNVVIELLSEDRSTVVLTYKLTNAFPSRYVGPHLLANGTDLLMEELVLTYESLVIS